jgi:beta-galactosidase
VDSARLTVNGTQVGAASTSTNHVYRWPGVRLARGANTVTVTGSRNGVTYTDSVVWTLR